MPPIHGEDMTFEYTTYANESQQISDLADAVKSLVEASDVLVKGNDYSEIRPIIVAETKNLIKAIATLRKRIAKEETSMTTREEG